VCAQVTLLLPSLCWRNYQTTLLLYEYEPQLDGYKVEQTMATSSTVLLTTDIKTLYSYRK
jgi:hypothetical protein